MVLGKGHIQWAWLLLLLFITDITSAAKSTSKVACQPQDATILTLRRTVGAPGDFCKWYNSNSRRNSPFKGVAAANIVKACTCINSKPGLLGPTKTRIITRPTGQSSVKGLTTLQKSVADPVTFCYSQSTSATRTSRRQVSSGIISSQVTLLPSSSSVTIRDGVFTSTWTSTTEEASTSTPVEFKGNYQTPTPVTGEPAPTATLAAMPPPGLDLTSLGNLSPTQNQSLFFAGKAGDDANTTVAAVSAAFLYHVNIRGQVAIGIQGQALAGFSWGFPNARTYVDFLNPKSSYSYGWTPKLDKKMEAYAEIFLELQFGLPVELAFGISMFSGLIEKQASLSFSPGVQARFAYTILDVSTDGTKKNSECVGGVTYGVGPYMDLLADYFSVKQVNLWHWEKTLISGCIGGKDSTYPGLPAPEPTTTKRKLSDNHDHDIDNHDDLHTLFNDFNHREDHDCANYQHDFDFDCDTTFTTSSTSTLSITTTDTTTTSTTSTTTTTSSSSLPSPTVLTCGSNYTTTDKRQWNVDCQTDYSGPLLKVLTAPNMTACVNACSDWGFDCRVVIWVPSGQAAQYCYLKSSYEAGAVAPSGLTVLAARPTRSFADCPTANATVFQPQVGGAYRIECGIDYLGDDLRHDFTAPSFLACQQLCDAESGCAGVSWIHGGRYASAPWCALKTQIRASAKTNSSTVPAATDKSAPGAVPSDGNLYLTSNYTPSNPPANFVLDAGFITFDTSDRIFLYFPDLMDAYGASRLRMAPMNAVPRGARMASWVPMGYNGTTILTAVNTVEEFFLPVVCVYSGGGGFKVLLVRGDVDDLFFLQEEGLQHVVTGGVVEGCVPISLTVSGVRDLVTLG
ncbi:hypothetical protein KVT40_000108 [Elsinoe batatas]|uniref:Apple domain-containing protein n=1 Tax=Elsinoe batatas TaxID=2601811 RepID=A0A8K0LEZ3_9PEZI|nr:hypothetical protein KVT40_000108 [Elsinoe batatas]